MISDALNRREGKGINLQIYISPEGDVTGSHMGDVDPNDMEQDDKGLMEGSPDEEKMESPDEEDAEKLGLAPEVNDTIPPKGELGAEEEDADPMASKKMSLGKMSGLMGRGSLAARMMKK